MLLVAACTGEYPKAGSPVATATTDQYVPVGKVGDQTISLRMTPSSAENADLIRPIQFGLAVETYKGVDAARAEGLSLTGAGDQLDSAYVIDGLARPQDAIAVAFSFIAKLYPERRDIEAILLRGQDKAYVAQIDFIDGNTPRRLYFDLTAWAETVKTGV